MQERFEVLAVLRSAGGIARHARLEPGVQGRVAEADRVVCAGDGLLIDL
jgi:hypothetical protein